MKKLEPPPDVPATIEQYHELLKDRPEKFAAEQVGYRPTRGSMKCAGCFHFYIGKEHNVCEIMRPEDEDVSPTWACWFWTEDGENFPLLEGDEDGR